jgi:hypothetical protein
MDGTPSFSSVPRVGLFFLCALICGAIAFLVHIYTSEARFMSTIRDTISSSAPGAYANHTIEFRLDTEVPPGGYLRITPEDGMFAVASSGVFTHRNVDLLVAAPSSTSYVLRDATTTPDATNDGIGINEGSSGNIIITLNSTTGIASGSGVRVVIGSNATYASSTRDKGIKNPNVAGTRSVYLEAGGGTETASARAMVAIIEQVGIGPLDTEEFIPPVRFNGAPTTSLSHTATVVELSLETDEFAKCRYALTPGITYFAMTREFNTSFTVVHTSLVSGLTASSTYSYFVRCIDDEGNFNSDDYEIRFSIRPVPNGSPSTGTTTTSDGGGQGTGTGSGNGGSGSGSSSGSGSGGGSGGSGGGGGSKTGDDDDDDGGGGFESGVNPYPSGDAQVTITGYAFPGSRVTVLVDGKEFTTTGVGTNGVFSVLLDRIARGVYTFGVFATDAQGTKSSTFSTSFSVIGARSSTLGNVHIMPSIKVTPNPVEPNQKVVVSGYAIQNSTIEIENSRQKPGPELKKFTTTSDGSGKWSLEIPTTNFQRDTWKVRAKSVNTTTGISSQFSNYTLYGVGQAVAKTNNSDLNRDGKVNLIDFSILLFHWNTNGGTSNPPADINQDGKVSLTDFSIMIFNWTG